MNNNPREAENNENEGDETHNDFFQYIVHALAARRASGGTNEEMVRRMKDRGMLTTERVEKALLALPRGSFIPSEHADEAYVDSPIRIAKMGFNVSAPHMYALCLENLQLEPGHMFLDIGSGCGHMTALGGFLVAEGGESHGLEIRKDVIDLALDNLKRVSEERGIELPNVSFSMRNCFLPDPDEIMYDRIHVGAACPITKVQEVLKILKPGGICVTPVGDELVKYTKSLEGKVTKAVLAEVRYGDLIVPSETEVKQATLNVERKKHSQIVVPPETLQEDLGNLIDNDMLSDLVFKFEDGKEIKSHKVILASRSEFFKNMFTSGMLETRSNEMKVVGFTYPVLMHCLKYAYTGKTDFLNENNVIDVLAASSYYKFERLKAVCEEMMKDGLDIENAAYILEIAEKNSAAQLKRVCLDYILQNYDAVRKTPHFVNLPKELLIEVTQAACEWLTKHQNLIAL